MRPQGQLLPLVQRAYYANDNVRDTKFEKELAKKKLESHPEQVTEESSVRPSYEGPETKPSDPPTTAGVKKDLVSSCLQDSRFTLLAILLTVYASRTR